MSITNNWKKYYLPYLFLLVVVVFFIFSLSTVFAEEEDGRYLIGPEDILEIAVWKDPELTKQVVVRPDGRISFPLIGEVEAGRNTVKSLEEKVKKRIRDYVPDAMVTVMVTQVNSIKIYVIGKVTRPGEYRVGHAVNVMQALSLAGGLSTFADANSILVLRNEKGSQTKILFNYDKVKKGKNLEQNIVLQSGDVLVVP